MPIELKKTRVNIILALLFILISLFLFYFAIPWGIPIRASWGGDIGVDSRTFPKFTAISMGLVSFLFLVVSLIKYRHLKSMTQAQIEGGKPSQPSEKMSSKEEGRALITFLLFVLYAVLLSTIGFIPSTLIVPPLILYFLGERKVWNYVGVYIFGGILFVIFQLLLKVQLP